MNGYDYDRPFVAEEALDQFTAIDIEVSRRFGKFVKATVLSNIEYKIRYGKLQKERNMKPPPSTGRIFAGYLVVRKLRTPEQYETWMPDHVFNILYEKA
jgi:hypothetical protein